tara:strand:+ start:397 stop:669 length:273 start_codon:yes stop_codon:yes gene_type:complete
METRMHMLDGLVVKQAVRDVASKNPDLSNQAILYFHSKDFSDLCSRNNIDGAFIVKSIKDLSEYPIISRKKIANDIASLIDSNFAKGGVV